MSLLDDDFIQELKAEFCLEAEEKVANCESILLDYEQSKDPALIDALKRELHSLKGSSRGAGMELFSQLTHKMESYCENRERPDFVGELLKCVDRLGEYVKLTAQKQEDQALAKLEKEFSQLAS